MSTETDLQFIPTIITIDKNKKDEVSLTPEEECELYKQRYNSLRLVNAELGERLEKFKMKCSGVDTISRLLDETRKENTKYSKHVKALERSISILQKRLEKHGLSNSVYTQETELFVPGASKQTLDNLVKENARLRTLLKQDNGHLAKKPSDEIEEMKTALENARSESEQLKNKLKNADGVKLKLAKDYEDTIEKLTMKNADLNKELEKELHGNKKAWKDEHGHPFGASVGNIHELKELLGKTVEKCTMLNDNLSLNVTNKPPLAEKEKTDNEMVPQVNVEELEEKYKEAVGMNQQWQRYGRDREKQIQVLNDRIQELSDPQQRNVMVQEICNQKTAQFTNDLSMKEREINNLQKQIKSLENQLCEARKMLQSEHDTSTVEILKQQIQVCTEDFNTERKDREKAVKREKAAHEEKEKISIENSKLRIEIESLTKALDQQRQQQSQPPNYDAYVRHQHSTISGTSPPPAYNSQLSYSGSGRYPLHRFPVQESPSQSGMVLGQPLLQPMPFSDYSQPSNLPGETIYRIQPVRSEVGNYASLPRNPRSASPLANSNLSMPPLMTRSASASTAGEKELQCLKCEKSFPENVLFSHMDECNK